MESKDYLLAHIFCHHPATYPYVRMLNKSYIQESIDLLLQTEGQYPISYKEFTQLCSKDHDFVCFALDYNVHKRFRVFYRHGNYCHIKEVMLDVRQNMGLTYFRSGYNRYKHGIVNTVVELLKVRNHRCFVFFDVKTTYEIYLQRRNCSNACSNACVDYAIQAAKKCYFYSAKTFNHIGGILIKEDHLKANYYFLKNLKMPRGTPENIKIDANNYENLLIKLKQHQNYIDDISLKVCQETIQNYFTKLK
jgi:hypothetical protein